MNLVFASGFFVPQRVFKGIDYFRGVDAHVRQTTPHVPLFPDVDPLAKVEVRAQQLATGIQAGFPSGPVHIIAHSMGGLDSRVLIEKNLNGLAGRIVSVTTLSTPHKGSPVADLLVGDGPEDARRAFAAAIGRLGLNAGALISLTTEETKKLPDVARANPGIRFRCYPASGRPTDFLKFVPIQPTAGVFLPTFAYIKKKGEDSDGLVSPASGTYGDLQRVLQCDHADMVGYNLNGPLDPFQFDHLALYDEIIAKLEQAGG